MFSDSKIRINSMNENCSKSISQRLLQINIDHTQSLAIKQSVLDDLLIK